MIDKVAWILLRDKRVLGTRSKGKDTFYLPGGKREPGESDVDTLVREIAEELSVLVDRESAVPVGVFEAQAHGHASGTIVRMSCYTASFSGNLAAANEIEELAWLTLADRDRVSPVDRIIFAHLHEKGLLE
ncbi:NUDIX domain-containing protein [Lentzea sp. NBRC 105346]|uniref:NUDIX hydrolase n=1 Tax=Lentzea sp. NBRC 105346 TaxID=3032205 RepID=UPI00255566C9|nr:NUDIX domain-containing protein [Lentzea sp. NBRC 105346]